MKSSIRSLRITLLLPLLSVSPAVADTPLGWINSGTTSAYTTTQGEFEFSLAGLAVNDTIDFINARDDLIAADRRLAGKSGDLDGHKIEAHYGITDTLSVFLRRQEHGLTVELGEINSVNLVDIDTELLTEQLAAGAKWTLYQGNLLNSDNRNSALSLELTAYQNQSDDFDVVIDEISFDNLQIFFRDPQTFSVAALEDSGWKARFIYSWPMLELGVASLWAGYGESEAESRTTSDLTSATLKRAFEQEFDIEESYFYLGASLNLQLTPRLPLSINYEYISISDSDFSRLPENPPAGLPGFLAASQSTEDANHTLNARISYWLSPQFNVSLTGNLYSNQFLGVLPHYNNPLSGSFSSLLYGYAGLELGYRF